MTRTSRTEPSPSLVTVPADAAFDVALFGEAMLMLIADRPGPLEAADSFTRGTAGAEINVATGLARLGFKVGWASRLGADSMGRYLLARMAGEGVDCSRVVCDPSQRTGFLFKGRTADGSDPEVEYHRKGAAASLMTPADIDRPWLASARHLHATGVFPAISASSLQTARHALDIARAAGRSISFDPNLRPSLWPSEDAMRTALNAMAAQADWVLPGLAEGQRLTGEATAEGIARFYRRQGARLVVVKLGADGAYYEGVHRGRAVSGHVPAYPVAAVVDTVGAGDAFAVGVVSALLEGREVLDAVRRACWIGARQVQVLGDSEGLPTRAELAAFEAGHGATGGR
ncbi:MAG: sugar kinase [Comamonas sp.]